MSTSLGLAPYTESLVVNLVRLSSIGAACRLTPPNGQLRRDGEDVLQLEVVGTTVLR